MVEMKDLKRTEWVFGKDFKSHIALLWCQLQAHEIDGLTFAEEVHKSVGLSFTENIWKEYHRQKSSAFKALKDTPFDELFLKGNELLRFEALKLEKEFILSDDVQWHYERALHYHKLALFHQGIFLDMQKNGLNKKVKQK